MPVDGLKWDDIIPQVLSKYGPPTHQDVRTNTLGGKTVNLIWSTDKAPDSPLLYGGWADTNEFTGLRFYVQFNKEGNAIGTADLGLHSASLHQKVFECKEIYRKRRADGNRSNIKF